MSDQVNIAGITLPAAATLFADSVITAAEHNTMHDDLEDFNSSAKLALEDLETNHAKTTAPDEILEGKTWADTSTDPAILKYYKDGTTAEALVGATNTQTLTNKTLTSPTITGATLTTVDINSGNIDGTIIGAASPAAATVTTLTATTLGGALDANSQAITNVDINSGAIDGTTVGAASASTGAFTTATIGTAITTPASTDLALNTSDNNQDITLSPHGTGAVLNNDGYWFNAARSGPTSVTSSATTLLYADNAVSHGGDPQSVIGTNSIFTFPFDSIWRFSADIDMILATNEFGLGWFEWSSSTGLLLGLILLRNDRGSDAQLTTNISAVIKGLSGQTVTVKGRTSSTSKTWMSNSLSACFAGELIRKT